MELILWRHADAEPGLADLQRQLTDKGRRQAARVAKWLEPRLEGRWVVYASPAARTRQTADALGRPYDTRAALGTGTTPEALLRDVDWPRGAQNVIVVGHQPTLGRIAARLLTGHGGDIPVKKGALWWFTSRIHEGYDTGETLLRAVIGPDLAG